MTAQISDTVVYDRRTFALAGVNGDGLIEFDPKQFEVKMLCSACWHGYHCIYEVDDDRLVLRHLTTTFKPAQFEAACRARGWIFEHPKRPHPESIFGEDGYLYEEVRLPVPFTGGLLLGREFIQDLYVHMGFHPAYKYREVHELIFDDGHLTQTTDRSEVMAEFRQSIVDRPLEPGRHARDEDVKDWIIQTFSRRYSPAELF